MGRDFRDPRDAPLGVDADRARRGSRDGPLSAGSSNSDPPFGPPFRGGFGGRGRGRGRGDWDRGRGRTFYDDRDRDRYGPGVRARSQEGRYRERDERDRDGRFLDNEPRPRDPRDDRDIRERDVRAKVERTSHEPPPSTRDVSPPPVAPAAPSFGSVPNRTASVSEVSTVTGKAPPTGPRALKDERPPPSGPAVTTEPRLPPIGPSKSTFPEGAPAIPSGPRAHAHTHAQRTGPSSKQWINPALKRGGPESPKLNRSQSLAQTRFPPFRPENSSMDYQPDVDRRPRSSDAKVDPLAPSADDQSRDVHMSDSRHEADRFDRRPQSAGSLDRDYRSQVSPTPTSHGDAKGQDSHEVPAKGESSVDEKMTEEDNGNRKTPRKLRLGSLHNRIAAVRKQVKAPVLDQSSESDDEEFGDVIATNLTELEQNLKKLEALEEPTPVDVLVRHAIVSVEAVDKLVSEPEGLEAIIGPIPEGVKITKDEEAPPAPEEAAKTHEAAMSPVREVKAQEPIVPVASVAPVAPVAPTAPVVPVAPIAPVAHVVPVAPVAPVVPVSPEVSVAAVTPAVPASPTAPASPAAPVTSAAPVTPAKPVAPPEMKLQSPLAERIVPLAKEEQPQPSIEEDIDRMPVDEPQEAERKPANADDGDVVMKDVAELPKPEPATRLEVPQTNGAKTPKSHRSSAFPEDDPGLSKDGSKRGTSTPSPAEDEDETDVEDIDLQSVDTVRVHANTPPLDCLPEYDMKPWFDDRAFMKSLDMPRPALDSFILKRLNEDAMERGMEQQKHRKIYAGNYEAYLRFTMGDDPIAVRSREKFNYVPGAPDPPPQKPGYVGELPAKPESTRRSRYASERDLERVLEESRRVEDEKRERQLRAEKEKYRSEKEAIIPDMLQTREEIDSHFYIDETGRLDPDKIVAAWEVLPPVDNFTEEEVGFFEKAYLEFPKQWGRVSNNLKERDFGTTIQFYYLKKDKTELNLKEKLKKRPRTRRKGRGKQRSSALVSEFPEKDETHEVGENGERRRPRRAAAPTFNSEATPATDGENATGTSTPSRRGGGSRNADGGEKPERRRGRRAKDKQEKQAKGNQALAPVPATPTTGKGSRSRSTSRVQNTEWTIPQPPQAEATQGQPQFDLASGNSTPPVSVQPPFTAAKPLVSPERSVPPQTGPISDVMAPPPLRPEPPQPGVITPFELNQPPAPVDRKSGSQASSYWSVPEATDFPHLLSSFGSNWAGIAAHMRTKTAVMVRTIE